MLDAEIGHGDIRCKVVFEKKGLYIARTMLQGEQGVLVDDVSDQKLPEGYTEIHIDRTAQLQEAREIENGYQVSDLSQAVQIIKNIGG